MRARSDTFYLSKSDDKMTGRKEFCWGQLLGVFLFCAGVVVGIMIGIYVYHDGTSNEVICKNIPEWSPRGNVTAQSLQTTSTVIPTTTAKRKKTFTYTINNQLEAPFFHESMVMNIVYKKPLIYYMEKAVLTDTSRFMSFKAIFQVYEPIFSGYFIKAVNGREGFWSVNKTHWQITNSSGLIGLSVSNYIPSPNDVVLLNFAIGDPPSEK